jgi:hypothetical protein
MDIDGVRAAVSDVATLLRLDGADLEVVAVDSRIDRIDLRLVLDTVECLDCVLPPEQLRATVEQALLQRAPGEYEVRIDDPRR